MAEQPALPGTTALRLWTPAPQCGWRLSRNSDMDRFEAAAGLAILLRETAERVNVCTVSSEGVWMLQTRVAALRDAPVQEQLRRGTRRVVLAKP